VIHGQSVAARHSPATGFTTARRFSRSRGEATALIFGLVAVLAPAAGAVVFGAASHKSSKSSYKATFHDAYVSGDPTAEIHHGTYKFTIAKGSTKLRRLGFVAAIAAKLSGGSR
jgi:hypothetical protein